MNIWSFKLILMIVNLNNWSTYKRDTDEERISELGDQVL